MGVMDAAGHGILIAVEGIDGAGKTTLVGKLRDVLSAAGETVVNSKEPTDGKWGKMIRESAQSGRLRPVEELRAFVEDRREHVAHKIRPALDRGDIVILDRYFYSTIAYQGARENNVQSLCNEMRDEFPIPDAVLLLDAPPAITLHRVCGRGDIPNEFERLEALESVRSIFTRMANVLSEIHVVDARRGIDDVFQDAAHILLETALKKRCAKSYGCDIFYCSYRENGECRWANLYRDLRAPVVVS